MGKTKKKKTEIMNIYGIYVVDMYACKYMNIYMYLPRHFTVKTENA